MFLKMTFFLEFSEHSKHSPHSNMENTKKKLLIFLSEEKVHFNFVLLLIFAKKKQFLRS